MSIKEIQAKSILRKHRRVDSWFISGYGMNLYRGCTHNCAYCDGRSEKYQVDGEFGCDIAVKTNAVEVLRRELDPRRKRKPMKRSFVMLGGGVGDSYQPVEKKYGLTRKALNLLYEFNLPVHVLTKSTMIERDMDIIRKINEMSRALVSFSFSSVDDETSAVFEPGVPAPSERLRTLARFKSEGIACGMFLMPVIPFVTDRREFMEDSVRKARDAGLDYIVFGGMTLKEGRQKEYFIKNLEKYRPGLSAEYENIYRGGKWGEATGEYYGTINKAFNTIAKEYGMAKRIPASLFRDILAENDLVSVILDQMDYLLKLEGRKSPFGYASHVISGLERPLSSMGDALRTLKGIGPATERMILEILETKTASHYESLLRG